MNARTREDLLREYEEEKRGVSHATLTRDAFAILTRDLALRGNNLSDLHREALYELCGTMTRIVKGDLRGRIAFGLPTGSGKTSAIVAFVAALYGLGERAEDISLSVAAGQVEALCRLKRELIAHGVPEEQIGLRHSYAYDPRRRNLEDGYASEPSTDDSDRRFQLITHQRVRSGRTRTLFTEHKGKPRALMIYDESLFRSDSAAVGILDARKGLAWFREGRAKDNAQLLAYLDNVLGIVERALAVARKSGEPQLVTLPGLSEIEAKAFPMQLGNHPAVKPLQGLLSVAGCTVRVLDTAQGGVAWHQLAVPEELDNMLILDASWPIRELARLDPTVRSVSRYEDAEIKRYDRVEVVQLLASGSRTAMERAFRAKHCEGRRITREVADILKQTGPKERSLVFVYKDRGVDFRDILLRDLHEYGVDLSRVSVLTWGNETSLNDYADCSTVVLVGVLHRDRYDLAAAALGQLADPRAPVTDQLLDRLLLSERAHLVYQAASRGACRVVENGQAKPMKLYVFEDALDLRRLLEPVMPGVQWTVRAPTHYQPNGAVIKLAAVAIAKALEDLPAAEKRISTVKLKARFPALKAIPANTFSAAAKRLHEVTGRWRAAGRAFSRVDYSDAFN